MFNRIAVNSAIWNKDKQLDIWKQKHGKQAVIANFPFRIINGTYVFYDLSENQPYAELDFIIEKATKYDEIVLHYLDGHGFQLKFPKELVHKFAEAGINIIISGGITEKSYSDELDLIIRSRVIDNYSLYSDIEFKKSSRNVV
jgi:imidazole glycerol phosphate synthase subunit HisF